VREAGSNCNDRRVRAHAANEVFDATRVKKAPISMLFCAVIVSAKNGFAKNSRKVEGLCALH
jgi:hypothetical protein